MAQKHNGAKKKKVYTPDKNTRLLVPFKNYLGNFMGIGSEIGWHGVCRINTGTGIKQMQYLESYALEASLVD